MNSAYSLMTMDRDLEDRPVCITCKQSVSVKNGYKLFIHLCNYILGKKLLPSQNNKKALSEYCQCPHVQHKKLFSKLFNNLNTILKPY